MNDSTLLYKVKSRLGITLDNSYHDETLAGYIEEVKFYLINGGVKENVVNSSAAVGVICRGVSDLWNYGSGAANLSEYFYQRAKQLVYVSGSDE